MWHYDYDRATELNAEWAREAALARLAAQVPHLDRPPLIARLRRAGALAAVGIAHRLDKCVTREAAVAMTYSTADPRTSTSLGR